MTTTSDRRDRVRRESILQVLPGEGWTASIIGLARDTVLSDSPTIVAEVGIKIEVSEDGLIATLAAGSLQSVFEPLIGTQSGSGFRRRLGQLANDTPELKLAHRLLDDLPILIRVASQAKIVDHPALARPTFQMNLAGADQCEGWRSDGTMLRGIEEAGGILQMALSEPVDDSAGAWQESELSELPPLPAQATRRRRRVHIVPVGDGLDVQVDFRDSYADPDGLERGLHGYAVSIGIDAQGLVQEADADGVVLPWPECWRVTGSAKRLLGLSLPQVEQAAKTELVGHGTCTHLNDTLRALVDVSDLAGLIST
ncbi:MAG: hypothetical protein JWM76_478 [Pseudonocardiales bacterium]|nr:hypothetical protein [Pseudonocardiales bacterium]